MLKTRLGSAMLVTVPKRKDGTMLYRVGTDFMKSMHSFLLEQQKTTDVLQSEIDQLQKKMEQMRSNPVTKLECLDKVLAFTRQGVKSYVLN